LYLEKVAVSADYQYPIQTGISAHVLRWTYINKKQMLNQQSFPYASINPCWQASDQPISMTRSSIHWIATLKRETILVNSVKTPEFLRWFSAKIHGEMGIVQGGFAFAKQREIALLPGSPRSKGSRRSIEMGKMQVTNK